MGSGIPRALQEWEHIELADDVSGNQFSAIMLRPASIKNKESVTSGIGLTPPVETLLRLLAEKGPMSSGELRKQLNLNDRKHFRKNYIEPAFDEGLIAYTIPEKPMSSRQKYRLTAAGRARLQH